MTRHYAKLGLLMVLFITILSTTVFAFEGGDGSPGSPFEIATCEQLQNISNNLNSHFELISNVDCSDTVNWNSGQGFVPIPSSFAGTLDGNKRAIRDLYINRTSSNQALFAGSSSSANITNLRLENVYVRGTQGVGSIGGQGFSGSIYNVSVRGVIIGSGSRVGGLVGQLSDAYVDQVSFVGNVTGGGASTHEVGGIVGRTSGNTQVGTAYAQGFVFGQGCMGGLIGDSSTVQSSFIQMYSAVQVSGTGYGLGAIVGCVRNAGDSFTNMYWDNEISLVDWQGSVHTANPLYVNNVTGFNTIDMIGQAAEDNFTGFDFVNVWRTVTLPENDYPVFFWQAGDPVSVTGFVNDSFTGDPIENAEVRAVPDDSNFGTIVGFTNSSGWFNITLQSVPDYEIIVRRNVTDDSDGFNFIGGDRKSISPSIIQQVNFSLGPFFIGEGTISNPFQITNVDELQKMRYNLSAHYILMNDINASNTTNWFIGAGFEPVGSDTNPFTGSLNGQGFEISNLFINRYQQNHTGLFGMVYESTIANITLNNVNIAGNTSVGAIVGSAYHQSVLLNVHSSGYVQGIGGVGGLVGVGDNFAIEDSSSNVTVQGSLAIGGLIGFMGGAEPSFVGFSMYDGLVNASQWAGGLIGAVSSDNLVSIYESYSKGIVQGEDFVGGFIGYMSSVSGATLIEDSYSHATVIGVTNVGGFVGFTENTTIETSYSVGLVKGLSDVGGFIGFSENTDVLNSFWDVETSNQTISAGGEGLLTGDMKLFSTFDIAEWNFTGVWGINESVKDGYPFLLWQGFGSRYPFENGNGTSENPYGVIDCYMLQSIDQYLNAYYVLLNDIDCSDTINWNDGDGFEPIGSSSNRFTGSFNGAGYTISDLFINRSSESYVGLFGAIENAKIQNFDLKVQVLANYFSGGLAGHAITSDIYNIHVTSDIFSYGNSVNASDTGGFIGELQGGNIVNVSVFSNVSGFGRDIGGMIGYIGGSDLNYITGVFGVVNVTQRHPTQGEVGGLVGGISGSNTLINNTYIRGIVMGTNNSASSPLGVGGLIGGIRNTNSHLIYNSYAVALVSQTGDGPIGGLIGSNANPLNTNIVASFWDTQTSNQTNSSGGEGKTTAQMRQVSTFTGWNFTDIWSSVCDGWDYPTLQWQNLYASESQCPNYVAPVQEQSLRGGSSTTGRVAQTFVVPNPDVNEGNRQTMQVADRVEFEARHTSDRQINIHRLTLNRFNQTHADVTVQSDPIRNLIALNEEWYVDLDGDGEYDIFVRYDGIENGRAIIFIQEVVEEDLVEEILIEEPLEDVLVVEEPVIEDAEEIVEEPTRFPWWIVVVTVLLFAIYFYSKKK